MSNWLSSTDINDMMIQYENKYNDFKFLGAVPIDFDALPQLGISNLDLNSLVKAGKTKLSIVFNLDESYKSGSFWVASFANLKEGKIFYYDSTGSMPERRVKKYMKRIVNFYQNDLRIKNIVVAYNKIKHIYEVNECIDFILQLLNGNTFEQFCNSRTIDEK